MKKINLSARLSAETLELLVKLKNDTGLNKTQLITMSLRVFAAALESNLIRVVKGGDNNGVLCFPYDSEGTKPEDQQPE